MIATTSDVAVRLGGVSFTTTEAANVELLIAAAQAHLEREARRPLEAASRTEVFDPPETADIWLTHTPVDTDTTFTVTVDGTELTANDYSVDEDTGRLTRVVGGRPRPWSVFKVQSISVTYTGGYSDVPDDLVDVCARAAARAYQAGLAALDAPALGVKQINLSGSDSVTFVDEVNDVTVALSLTEEEKQVARYYRNGVVV